MGGRGFIVFIVAIFRGGDGSIHVWRAEMPGPTVDKIAPRSKDTAKILYLIYVARPAVGPAEPPINIRTNSTLFEKVGKAL